MWETYGHQIDKHAPQLHLLKNDEYYLWSPLFVFLMRFAQIEKEFDPKNIQNDELFVRMFGTNEHIITDPREIQ